MDQPSLFEKFVDLPDEIQSQVFSNVSPRVLRHAPELSRSIQKSTKHLFLEENLYVPPTRKEIKDYQSTKPFCIIVAIDDNSEHVKYPVDVFTYLGYVITYSVDEENSVITAGYYYIPTIDDGLISLVTGTHPWYVISNVGDGHAGSKNSVRYFDVLLLHHVFTKRLALFQINDTLPYIIEYLNRMKNNLNSVGSLPTLFQYLRSNARMLLIPLNDEENDYMPRFQFDDIDEIAKIRTINSKLLMRIIVRLELMSKM